LVPTKNYVSQMNGLKLMDLNENTFAYSNNGSKLIQKRNSFSKNTKTNIRKKSFENEKSNRSKSVEPESFQYDHFLEKKNDSRDYIALLDAEKIHSFHKTLLKFRHNISKENKNEESLNNLTKSYNDSIKYYTIPHLQKSANSRGKNSRDKLDNVILIGKGISMDKQNIEFKTENYEAKTQALNQEENRKTTLFNNLNHQHLKNINNQFAQASKSESKIVLKNLIKKNVLAERYPNLFKKKESLGKSVFKLERKFNERENKLFNKKGNKETLSSINLMIY